MATLEVYRDRFAESGWRIFERALAEARRRKQHRVGTEHVLYSLMQENDELFTGLLLSIADNPEAFAMLAGLVEQRLERAPEHESDELRLATEVIALFKRTLRRVRAGGRQRMEATDLFVTLMLEEQSLLRILLRELMADPGVGAVRGRELFAVVENGVAASRPSPSRKYQYLAGEMVRIKSGPFASFTGAIEEVEEEGSTLRVSVSILGRKQPVELKFHEVEKLEFDE